MNAAQPSLTQRAAQTAKGPGADAARTLGDRALAALFALLDAQIAGMLAALERLITLWRAGTLPPPPPARSTQPRQPRANRPIPASPHPALDQGWFPRHIHPAPAPGPAPASLHAPAPQERPPESRPPQTRPHGPPMPARHQPAGIPAPSRAPRLSPPGPAPLPLHLPYVARFRPPFVFCPPGPPHLFAP